MSAKNRSTAVVNLTLDAVIDLSKRSLVRELHFVRENVTRGRVPVDHEVVVSRDPLRTDVRVYLDAVRLAIVGRGGDRVVR